MLDFIQIAEGDQVAVALRPLAEGERLEIGGKELILAEDIPQGHKFSLVAIQKGGPVIKYGARIGFAKEEIPAGAWVHVHNLRTALGEVLSYEYHPAWKEPERTPAASFMGYPRKDGSVGVRNEIWILPTVGCVNSVVRGFEAEARRRYAAAKGVEAILALNHPYGCSQMGEDQENTRRALADMVHHPNAAGVLLVGLGCENSGIPVLMDYIGKYDAKRVKFMSCQDFEDETEEAMRLIGELCEAAAEDRRVPCGASKLVVGMKCGGSDGLSGITANPAVGAFSDLLISKGGTTLLTEVPEMFGAETLLMERCRDEETFRKTVRLINEFKEYFIRHDQAVYENPSPGNKQGGISTLEDKSLGCTQKSGSAPVEDVLEYAERVKKTGLNLLSAPGNDLVAATALALSGAQIILFTTGRGTPFAALVPTVKISSNSGLAAFKSKWIDFDAGRIAEGETREAAAQRLLDYVLRVASGERVKSEAAGFRDIAIFKQGVTL